MLGSGQKARKCQEDAVKSDGRVRPSWSPAVMNTNTGNAAGILYVRVPPRFGALVSTIWKWVS